MADYVVVATVGEETVEFSEELTGVELKELVKVDEFVSAMRDTIEQEISALVEKNPDAVVTRYPLVINGVKIL